MTPHTLFLHGGPAMNAHAELAWHGDACGIDWWTQPRSAPSARGPYVALLDAARTRLHATAAAAGGKVHLLAHDFGAQVALDLLSTEPHRVASITLLAPTHDMRFVWLRVARLLLASGNFPQLDAATKAFAKDNTSVAALQALWQELHRIPTLFDVYWGPASQSNKKRHQLIWNTHPDAFDFLAFSAVATDFLRWERLRTAPASAAADLPVRIFYGACDAVTDRSAGSQYWLQHFPDAAIHSLPCGHFPQFEAPLMDLLALAYATASAGV